MEEPNETDHRADPIEHPVDMGTTQTPQPPATQEGARAFKAAMAEYLIQNYRDDKYNFGESDHMPEALRNRLHTPGFLASQHNQELHGYGTRIIVAWHDDLWNTINDGGVYAPPTNLSSDTVWQTRVYANMTEFWSSNWNKEVIELVRKITGESFDAFITRIIGPDYGCGSWPEASPTRTVTLMRECLTILSRVYANLDVSSKLSHENISEIHCL